MQHQCNGITCEFPYCQNNPKNNPTRHRAGLPKRMTLAEFRRKYGTTGVKDVLTFVVEHVPMSKQAEKGFRELIADITSLLSEE